MATVTPLKKAEITALAAIGITSKTEEDARKKLIAFLGKNDVEGVDDDELKSLIEMAEVFYEPSTEVDEDADIPPVEEEELEEVVVKPTVKKGAPGKTATVVAEEDELEEVVEEVKSKGITTKKPATTTVKSAPKTGVGRKTELTGDKWDGRSNKAHDAMIKPFRLLFSEKEFQIDLLKQGFTVRVLGTNAKTTVMNFDEIRIDGGKLVGNLYCNRFKSVEDLNEFLPEAYQEPEKVVGMFRGESHPCVRKVTSDELIDILKNSDLLTESLKRASATDIKMGNNREKLENSIKTTTTPAAKTPATKKPVVKAPVVEEVEEIEELVEEVEELDEVDEFAGMDRTQLKQWIAANAAEQIKVFKTDEDEAIREKIRAIVE